MKKIFLSIFGLLVMFCFTLSVNAQSSVLNLSENTKAKAPAIIPNASDTVYATLTDEFDFSRVKFSTTSGGTVDGMTDVRKIILSKTLNYSTTNLSLESVLGSDWFTAYCLDGNMNYPQYGTYTSVRFLNALNSYRTATTDAQRQSALEKALETAVRGALVNKESLQSVLRTANGYVIGPDVTFALDTGKTITDYFVINGTDVALKDGDLVVLIKKVTYTNLDLQLKEITGTDLAQGGSTIEVDGVQAYKLTFTAEEVSFDRYTTTNDLNASEYEQALWILEHSYPTITIDAMLELVGVNKSTLITELKAIDSRITDSNVNDYLDNYLYATIQYAIWKVYNGKEGLGDTITNVGELDKLYKFYIQSRSEYNGYSNLSSGGEIKITNPAEGKELYKTTDTTYTYGPFKAKFTGIMSSDSNNELSLRIKDTDSSGIKIINSVGTEINSIRPDEDFYIEIQKNAQIGSVSVETSVEANTYTPAQNRGRIYYPKYVLAQNVMSGGRIGTDTIKKDFTIAVNAKTGVENVAVLLMVTLVAFSLGYLVLSYKGKGSFLK